MMNSVTFRAPRCSVSERFQMRPRTSFGSLAFSKISFAFSPDPQSVFAQKCHSERPTREHAIDGTRLLKQACILGGLRGNERRDSDGPLAADLRLEGSCCLGGEALGRWRGCGGYGQALELGERCSCAC